MTINKPTLKPNNPNFSSGPTTKRPNWSLSNLESALLGRSHRSIECKERLKTVIDKIISKEKLPPKTVVLTFDDGLKNNYLLLDTINC